MMVAGSPASHPNRNLQGVKEWFHEVEQGPSCPGPKRHIELLQLGLVESPTLSQVVWVTASRTESSAMESMSEMFPLSNGRTTEGCPRGNGNTRELRREDNPSLRASGSCGARLCWIKRQRKRNKVMVED